MKTLGEKIKRLRIQHKFTQAALAKKVTKLFGEPVSQQNIQQLETGKPIVIKNPRYLHELCNVLGTTAKQLKADEDNSNWNTVMETVSRYDDSELNADQKTQKIISYLQSGRLSGGDVDILWSLVERLTEETRDPT